MLKNSLKFQKQATRSKIMSFTSGRSFHMLSRGFMLVAAFSTIIYGQSAAAETFYKWVGKDGSTHYTQTPPGKNGVRSAKKVYIDDLAPPTPVAPANAENSNGTANSTPTSVMDANQLANAANNGSIPNSNGQQIPPAVTAPQPQPVITPVTPPPANRLIVPTQDQTRPAFTER